MADESVDEFFNAERDKRDRYTKAVRKRAERRKTGLAKDEAYRAAFALLWSRRKLDADGIRLWGEQFAERGRIIASENGLANRLHGANLDGQNVALAGAVKL